jgi:hypothetical protein
MVRPKETIRSEYAAAYQPIRNLVCGRVTPSLQSSMSYSVVSGGTLGSAGIRE